MTNFKIDSLSLALLATGVLLPIAILLSPLGLVFFVTGVLGLVDSVAPLFLTTSLYLRGEVFFGDTFLVPDHPHLDLDTFRLVTCLSVSFPVS